MPFIQTKLSCPLSQEKEAALKAAYGKIISLYPGKSESWLMLSFEDSCHMYFQGDNQRPAAFVEVKIFGKEVNSSASEKMTQAICETLEKELSIPKDRVYVAYSSSENWGWNGSNF